VTEKPHAPDDHGHGHDAHGHHGSVFIQHHYDDAQHQFDSGKLGIWLFLAQEVLFFSALFVAYILYRHHHPEIYAYAHKYLDTKMGAINTAVLIFSSLTAAWAVRAAQLRQKKLLVACLAATLACACTFLVVKQCSSTGTTTCSRSIRSMNGAHRRSSLLCAIRICMVAVRATTKDNSSHISKQSSSTCATRGVSP
jgi:hypothetical protein